MFVMTALLTACANTEVRYVTMDPSVQFDVLPDFVKSVEISDKGALLVFKSTMCINKEVRDGMFKDYIVDSVTLNNGEGFGMQGVGYDKYVYAGQHNESYVLKHFSSRANRSFVWINKINH